MRIVPISTEPLHRRLLGLRRCNSKSKPQHPTSTPTSQHQSRLIPLSLSASNTHPNKPTSPVNRSKLLVNRPTPHPKNIMSEQSPPSPPGGGRRRSSITEMFMSRPNMGQSGQSGSPPNASPGSANAQGARRAMSITTLGLSGANSANSPYSAFARQRRASGTSSASGSPEFRNSFEENAVIEEDSTEAPAPTPTSPSFSRRVSFGAQALRDVRGGPGSGGRQSNLITALQQENPSPGDKASTLPSSAKTGNAGRGLSLPSAVPCYLFIPVSLILALASVVSY